MEEANFKTLVGVKWKSRHFHVIGEGFATEKGTRIIIFSSEFPDDFHYKENVQQIDYQFDTNCLQEVDAPDHRFLCTQLVDLDVDWKVEEPQDEHPK